MLLYEIYMYGIDGNRMVIGYYYAKDEKKIKEEVERLLQKMEKDREKLDNHLKILNTKDMSDEEYEEIKYTCYYDGVSYKIIDLDKVKEL